MLVALGAEKAALDGRKQVTAGVLSSVEDVPEELVSPANAVCPLAIAVDERGSGRVKYLEMSTGQFGVAIAERLGRITSQQYGVPRHHRECLLV